MNICVVGSEGVVGSAVSLGLERLGHTIKRHDIRLGTDLLKESPGTDITFICVPTNSNEDGSCDTSIVETIIKQLYVNSYRGIIAIKSTIEPGTTEKIINHFSYGNLSIHNKRVHICFVPEFLRERSAFHDFTEGHDVLAVGTHDKWIYDKVVETHGRYPKTSIMLSPTEAELLKYYSNVYNALRVTWANGFYDVCQKLGANYSKVKDAFIKRGTATDMYLDCNENLRGFSGPCLPKESAAFAFLASKLGVEAQIFNAIVDDNKLYRKTVWPGMRE